MGLDTILSLALEALGFLALYSSSGSLALALALALGSALGSLSLRLLGFATLLSLLSGSATLLHSSL